MLLGERNSMHLVPHACDDLLLLNIAVQTRDHLILNVILCRAWITLFFFATFYLPCLAKEVKCRLNCLRPDAAAWPKGPRATNATAHHRVIKKSKMLQKMDLPHFF